MASRNNSEHRVDYFRCGLIRLLFMFDKASFSAQLASLVKAIFYDDHFLGLDCSTDCLKYRVNTDGKTLAVYLLRKHLASPIFSFNLFIITPFDKSSSLRNSLLAWFCLEKSAREWKCPVVFVSLNKVTDWWAYSRHVNKHMYVEQRRVPTSVTKRYLLPERADMYKHGCDGCLSLVWTVLIRAIRDRYKRQHETLSLLWNLFTRQAATTTRMLLALVFYLPTLVLARIGKNPYSCRSAPLSCHSIA